MAGKVAGGGEGFPADFAGMTKSQLYDIMSQMKALIEQNKDQAREVLVQNPLLTKALFQAQIMLGMLQPPQVVPNIHRASSQQQVQTSQQPNIQAIHPLTWGLYDQTSTSEAQPMTRKHPQTQSSVPASSAHIPPVNLQSQPIPSNLPEYPKAPPVAMPQSIPLPLQSSSQFPAIHQQQMPTVSSQLQQPHANPHVQLQPPVQSRPSTVPSFHHQYGSQMGPSAGFQHTGVPPHSSQPMFHGQPSMSNQTSFQPHFQTGGPHMGIEFNNAVGSQLDRGPSWMPGPPDNSALAHIPGPPSLGSESHSNQPAQASLTPEMEQTLLQQVMSLSPEQINNLPPEQRHQVLQLQQMLRQRK